MLGANPPPAVSSPLTARNIRALGHILSPSRRERVINPLSFPIYAPRVSMPWELSISTVPRVGKAVICQSVSTYRTNSSSYQDLSSAAGIPWGLSFSFSSPVDCDHILISTGCFGTFAIESGC